MPADDIYLAEFHFEGPTSAASFGVHYQEVIEKTGIQFSTIELAAALIPHCQSEILGAISNDWHFAGVTVRVQNNAAEPHHRQDVIDGIGLRAGPSLPANMAWIIMQGQSLFSNKSNGRVFIPGVSIQDVTIGTLNTAYVTGVGQDLADCIGQTVAQLASGAGRWAPGVISRKKLDEAPPFKDWEGAFAPIESSTAWPIVSSRRRRKTRSIGAAEVSPP